MRTLAIGDIHGCHTALTTLLNQVQPVAGDSIIFLGDYVDRGPASRSVVETLLEVKQLCSPIFLRGNHEVMILQARKDPLRETGWQSCGGFEALVSYGVNYRGDWVSRIPATHWRFFERTVNFFETETHIFVHACLDAELDMKDQPDWLLYWETFDRIKPHKSGKKIVCGHTAQGVGKPRHVGFATCIDTAPASGGWLTCMDVATGKYWQTNERGQTRDGSI
jgi:serine/threonine protein phosphatase 1